MQAKRIQKYIYKKIKPNQTGFSQDLNRTNNVIRDLNLQLIAIKKIKGIQ